MYDKLTYALVPSGYKANKLYSFVGGDMTFSRATTATRINKDGYIELVPTGVPRLNYPLVNGVPSNVPELLLEPARINFQVYSEDFSNWTKNGTFTETYDYGIAPDGNKTSTRIYNTSSATGGFYRTSLLTAIVGEYYTFSIFGRHISMSGFIRVELNNAAFGSTQAIFDLIEGTVYSNTVNVSAKIEKYPNGWYRCSITAPATIATTITPAIYTSAGKDIEIWGAQLELGSYETSYIPTFDSTGSRNTDSSKNATAELNDAEGVLFCELQAISDVHPDNRYISISDGTASNMLTIRYSGTGGQLQIFNNGTVTGNLIYSENLDLTNNIKVAVKYGINTSDYKVYVNGLEKNIDGSFVASAMSGLDIVSFDYPTNILPFIGKVKQVLVFNEALTDSELETLTT